MSSSANCAELPSLGRSRLATRLQKLWPMEALGLQYWTFFAAAFFFDFGFDLFFFLFNLFLLNAHYDERAMGLISSALTLGNVVGTVPVAVFARRRGLQRSLLICFIAAPLISLARISILWMPAQVGLAFLTGAALSSWPVCFAPTVASLTTERNRVFGFSIIFATGIGTGTLAGLAGGYIPQMFKSVHDSGNLAYGMRLVLIGASLVAMVGIWPVARLKIKPPEQSEQKRIFGFHRYLIRFLPSFAIWSAVTGSFIPFAPVFFHKQLGLSLQHVGVIFSASELAQFSAVLLAPLLFRRAGSVTAIMCAQLVAGVSIFALGHSHGTRFAIGWYLAYTAVQFTAGPRFYGMLMSHLPEAERSSASATQNIVSALCQAGSAALTGIVIVRYGYSFVFVANAACAGLAALLVIALLRAKPIVAENPRTLPASG